MYDIRVEMPLDPPTPPPEWCCRCAGKIAVYADAAGAYCEDCAERIADDRYHAMVLEDKAEWAGLERVD